MQVHHAHAVRKYNEAMLLGGVEDFLKEISTVLQRKEEKEEM